MTEYLNAMPPTVQGDRAVGVIVASAAGDALGAGYEFGPALAPGTPVQMKGGGGYGWEPGEWTDDTQMALANLTPLAKETVGPAAIEAGFRAWFDSSPADVGIQTRAVLGTPGPLADAAARYAADRPDNSAGNGSLMRTGPIALAHPGDPAAIATLARQVSELTHPDPDCVDACVLWSVAIDDTIHHAPTSTEPWDWAESLRRALPHLPDHRQARWLALIDEAADATPLDFANNGWVVHAFQAALAAICSTPVPDGPMAGTHLRLALEQAVRAGGDTDTVAAIAGSLLGARWGATALPFEWRRLIHGRRIYGQPSLQTSDLEQLARLAFNGGQPDEHGWPSIASMVPYYRDAFGAGRPTVTLGGIQFGSVAGLSDALTDGYDTVISLCRMGTDEVPAGVEHHTLGLIDSNAEDNPNGVLLLADLIDAIQTFSDEGRQIYVHCVQAENRTPTVAAAWLHHHYDIPIDDAAAQATKELNRPKEFLVDALNTIATISKSR